jgi:hypothetical protein
MLTDNQAANVEIPQIQVYNAELRSRCSNYPDMFSKISAMNIAAELTVN